MWIYYVFFAVSAIKTKELLKVLATSYGLVIVSPLSRECTVGTLDATVFREIRDLIPFHIFLILFQLLSKYLLGIE